VTILVLPPNEKPSRRWLVPSDGDEGAARNRIILRGEATDPDDPYTNLSVEWSSSIDGELGSSGVEKNDYSTLTIEKGLAAGNNI
jgi:hypothetical protein